MLKQYWHPVALSDEVTNRPLAVQLLEQDIVLYRAGGRVVALKNLCVHRGTRLSLGWVESETLVCAYHGWAYAPDGACVRIPSLPPERAIPAKARATLHMAQERYGLVWVCLGEPQAPIPAFAESDNPNSKVYWRHYTWQANAARIIENFMDVSHFPWVHEGLLGDRFRPVYPPVTVEVREGELYYTIDDERNDVVRSFRVTLPFTLHEVRAAKGADISKGRTFLFTCCPLSPRETKHFFGVIFHRDMEQTEVDTFLDVHSDLVFRQDQAIVENQRPEELPLDLTAELHLRGTDAAALEYRRTLAALGVRW